MYLGIKRGADDLVVLGVGRGPGAGINAVEGQALGVGHSVVLPGLVVRVVQGAFQDPVSRPGGVRCLHDHIRDLEHLGRVTATGETLNSKVFSHFTRQA